eukprot:14591590-Heterocapsa_arctica.AAC.1
MDALNLDCGDNLQWRSTTLRSVHGDYDVYTSHVNEPSRELEKASRPEADKAERLSNRRPRC